MARLLVKSEGFGNQVIELKLGVNRLGRSPDNDFQIEHPTISANHCEVVVADDELIVETTEVKVVIPKFDQPRTASPIVLSDGSVLCPRHPQAQVTYQCTHCREVMCDACVHRLRRRAGKLLKLCPLCSHKCEPIGGEKKKKKSLLGFLQKTVK